MQEKKSELYFDLRYGASGDMLIASLINLTDKHNYVAERLKLLNLDGYKIDYKKEMRNHIEGGRFIVSCDQKNKPSRKYKDIVNLINSSDLNNNEKKLALKIFRRVAEAEAKVHKVNIEEVHFHEIGAIDSIIDIVGFSILYNSLNITGVVSSPFYVGSGNIHSMHGEIPVPVPATTELIKGLPVIGTEYPFEILTPTGAAILSTITDSFGPLPPCIIKNTGIGFGSRRENFNGLRVFEIERITSSPQNEDYNDLITLIETTIDDSTPEEIGHLQNLLLNNGVLDVYITPVVMKKSRPGFNISVLLHPQNINKITELIFKNSSTFGVRYSFYLRKILDRKIEEVSTPYGKVRVKMGILDGEIVQISPEYEDCARISERIKVPVSEIYQLATEKIKSQKRL